MAFLTGTINMDEKQKRIDELEKRRVELREEYARCLKRELKRFKQLNDEWIREKEKFDEWPVWKIVAIGMALPMAISTIAILIAITKF